MTSDHETPDLDDTRTVSALPARARERRALGSAESTLATMRDEEVATARTMIRVGRAIGIAAMLPLPILDGNKTMAIVSAATTAFAILVGIVVELRLRDPRNYRESMMVFVAASVLPAGVSGLLYWGIFSGAQLFPVLAIYFFSRRERFSSALAIYLCTAISQALLAALIITKVIPDPGMFDKPLSTLTLLIGHSLIQVGDLAALVAGWHSHRATQSAIEDHQNAMVLAAKREALLQEAREDLERAMRGGGAGRYTDQTFGSYRLGNLLGRGGMGEVYEARHLQTDEPAAVKLLPPRELANPRSIERFVREVRAVRTLKSPHVVRLLAASEERDAIPYFVMERLEGEDLAQRLRKSALPYDQLIELLGHVGDALAEAWTHGIVHRDLKPHNLFHDRSGNWKVLDFGVAALSDHAGTLTHGHVVGTPAYMAPEQARGDRVDHRADLYALAAIAYRWLTGRPVCSGDDLHASLYQVVHATPARPSALAELDPDVDAVLAIGLAKDPADRWSTAAELRDALATALAGRLDPKLRERAAAIVSRAAWGQHLPTS